MRTILACVVAFAACGTRDHPPPISDQGNVGNVAGEGASLFPAPAGDAGMPTRVDAGAARVVVIAANQPGPRGLASDERFLYFANAGTGASDGTIQRATLDGKNLVTLASGLASPGPMLFRGGALYWANEGAVSAVAANGSIEMLPLPTGAPQILAGREVAPSFLTADANNLFWTSNTFGNGVSVESVPRAGGRTHLLSTFPSPLSPGGIAVDERFVYFIGYGEGTGALFRTALAGEAPELIWQSDAGEPLALVLDGTTLYWVVNDAPANGAVLAMPITGTQPTRIARAQDHPVRLAVRDGIVYYVTSPRTGPGQLLAVPTTGGTPHVILGGLDQPRGILVGDVIHVATRDQVLAIRK
jgi:hypothetical protein